LARARVTANQVTVAAMVLSVATGVGLAVVGRADLFLLLPVVLLARMALNAVDGMLAREFGQKSTLGPDDTVLHAGVASLTSETRSGPRRS